MKALTAILFLLIAASCGVNKNIMFKSPKTTMDDEADSLLFRPAAEYTISRDDKFTFSLYTNEGKRIVENMTGLSENTIQAEPPQYIVRHDGTADLPMIDSLYVEGLTVKQLEDKLAKLYSKEYQEPFVQVKLTNQRVIVFPGGGSDAKVISLQNNNTTLMEVIAQAGGIAERGRADRVKVMRRINGEREVFELDLSTIEGLPNADIVVQANDYIYVEPSEKLTREVVKEAAPVVSLLSSALIIFTVFTTLK
jgi:polysaccharide biosynthesis/export protein